MASAGSLFGIALAGRLAPVYGDVLVVAAEKMGSFCGSDRNTAILFGDGAGACLVSADRPGLEIVDSVLHSDGAWANDLALLQNEPIRMNGPTVIMQAARKIPAGIGELLTRNGVGCVRTLALFLMHQANQNLDQPCGAGAQGGAGAVLFEHSEVREHVVGLDADCGVGMAGERPDRKRRAGLLRPLRGGFSLGRGALPRAMTGHLVVSTDRVREDRGLRRESHPEQHPRCSRETGRCYNQAQMATTRDRGQKIEATLPFRARSTDPSARRAPAFLDGACGNDDELRREVESLLAEDPTGQGLFDRPAAALLADSATMELRPDVRLGPYQIEGLIGEGGMGRVYKARDTRLGRTVAIKTSSVRFSKRFEREARAVAALNHAHICHLYDVGPDYLVMEYIEGSPVNGPMPEARALECAEQICDALEAAHRGGITHRDLKPGNILLTKHGIKLLDFGLALMEAGPDDPTLTICTRIGAVMGTPAYMAPEQWEGKRADARSDIYSFGCVLYEMLTGKRAAADRRAAIRMSGEGPAGTGAHYCKMPGGGPANALSACLRHPGPT